MRTDATVPRDALKDEYETLSSEHENLCRQFSDTSAESSTVRTELDKIHADMHLLSAELEALRSVQARCEVTRDYCSSDRDAMYDKTMALRLRLPTLRAQVQEKLNEVDALKGQLAQDLPRRDALRKTVVDAKEARR